MLWSLSPCLLLAFAHIDPELFTCVSWESCDKQPAHIVTPPLTLDSAAIIASVNRLCIVWIRAMCIIGYVRTQECGSNTTHQTWV